MPKASRSVNKRSDTRPRLDSTSRVQARMGDKVGSSKNRLEVTRDTDVSSADLHCVPGDGDASTQKPTGFLSELQRKLPFGKCYLFDDCIRHAMSDCKYHHCKYHCQMFYDDCPSATHRVVPTPELLPPLPHFASLPLPPPPPPFVSLPLPPPPPPFVSLSPLPQPLPPPEWQPGDCTAPEGGCYGYASGFCKHRRCAIHCRAGGEPCAVYSDVDPMSWSWHGYNVEPDTDYSYTPDIDYRYTPDTHYSHMSYFDGGEDDTHEQTRCSSPVLDPSPSTSSTASLTSSAATLPSSSSLASIAVDTPPSLSNARLPLDIAEPSCGV